MMTIISEAVEEYLSNLDETQKNIIITEFNNNEELLMRFTNTQENLSKLIFLYVHQSINDTLNDTLNDDESEYHYLFYVKKLNMLNEKNIHIFDMKDFYLNEPGLREELAENFNISLSQTNSILDKLKKIMYP